MKRTIKVIAEMGCNDHKALLLEMPQDMIQGLKIYADGTVDTQCLMNMLNLMEQEAELDQKSDNVPEQLNLMLSINVLIQAIYTVLS